MRIDKTPDEMKPNKLTAPKNEGKKDSGKIVDIPTIAELPNHSGKTVDIEGVRSNVESLSQIQLPGVLATVREAVEKQRTLYVFGKGHDLSTPITTIIRKAAEQSD